MEKIKDDKAANNVIDDDVINWDEAFKEERGETPKAEVTPLELTELKKTDQPAASLNLDFIMELPLNLTVELGRSRILIRDLLQLGQGSVIELTKLAGEPMDIFINNRLIARGEVVVVNEKFGIRLTDIISPEERINYLK
jgi:flagellar motor switch protein FliN/FliY